MIFIYPSIEDYYLPTFTRSLTRPLSSHSSDSSLFLLAPRDCLFGLPFPLGRPALPTPFPTLSEEQLTLSSSDPITSSYAKDASSSRRKVLMNIK
jgi:hypothetical protein